jgi:hypothetical protein
MPGAQIQLVAYGAQDVYLTGNPQITFFKAIYRRHTNFAIEAIEQAFNNIADLGRTFTYNIARTGDLLSRIYLEIDWTNSDVSNAWRLGHQIIDYAEIQIGSQIIDRQYGEWMDIWCQLTMSNTDMNKLSTLLNGKLLNENNNSKTYTPLQFWFCRNYGLALPLIALQYHDVKINIKLNDKYVYADPTNYQKYTYSNLQANSNKIKNVKLYCDYIFLDTDEKRRYAQSTHEHLIEQVQYSNPFSVNGGTDNQIEIAFHHPVKELFILLKRDDNPSSWGIVHPFDFWAVDTTINKYDIDLMKNMILQLDGQDRFQRREGSYFRCVQPFQHHIGGDRQVGYYSQTPSPIYYYLPEIFGGFYVYSFAIKPEDHQPSGTCNFSRINNALLQFKAHTQAAVIKVYAINYNVLKITNGMGGLAYTS